MVNGLVRISPVPANKERPFLLRISPFLVRTSIFIIRYSIFSFPLLSSLSCTPRESAPVPAREYHRIISLAPSITETFYALNGQDRLVGVTKFCDYPPAARSLPNVGGYIDPNFEAILRLRPDLVVLLKEHATVISFLKEHHIAFSTVNNQRLPDILASFVEIGRLCDREEEAKALVARIRSEFAEDDTLTGPRILLCVGRDGLGSGSISKVWVAGPTTSLGELLVAAGARNAVTDSTPSYPTFSGEAIMRTQPDMIVDLMASMAGIDSAAARNDWKSLTMTRAVQDGMVFSLSGDYLTIPGPRIMQTLQEFKRVVGEWRSAELGVRNAEWKKGASGQ